MESTKPNILVTLASDITLLLIMLVGLLRLRYRGDGAFGIASFLWKQVGICGGSSLLWCSQYTYVFSVRKGLIWLLLATIAEVPPAVCLTYFLAHLLFTHHHAMAGIYCFESERYCCFVSGMSIKDSVLNPIFPKYQLHSTLYVLVCYDVGKALIPFHNRCSNISLRLYCQSLLHGCTVLWWTSSPGLQICMISCRSSLLLSRSPLSMTLWHIRQNPKGR